MTAKTRSALLTEINANLADNTAGAITPALERAVFTDINDSAFNPLSDTLGVANGGTGVTAPPANGELLIGNGTGFSKAVLTAGSNITITNSPGGISIAAAGGGGSGNVTGPGTSTVNALAGYSTTGGGVLQNTPVLVDPSTGNMSGVGTLTSAAHTITSASASAIAVGPNGTTNPTFAADTSTASAATGVQVIGKAAASGVDIQATSSGTNEAINLKSKGTGSVTLQVGSTARFTGDSTSSTVSGTNINLNGLANMNGGQKLKRTTVADTNYTILTTDYLIAVTSITAARTITLPTAVANASYCVKDESGSASGTNTITIAGTIDGGANKVINSAYGFFSFYSNGTAWFTR